MYDQTNDHGIPVSAGIPPIVIAAVIFGIIVILAIITLVFANSGFGHAWPNTKAVEIPLTAP